MTTYEELLKERNRIDRQIKRIECNEIQDGRAIFKKVKFYRWKTDIYAIYFRTDNTSINVDDTKDYLCPVARGLTIEDCIKNGEKAVKDLSKLIEELKKEYMND